VQPCGPHRKIPLNATLALYVRRATHRFEILKLRVQTWRLDNFAQVRTNKCSADETKTVDVAREWIFAAVMQACRAYRKVALYAALTL
jgi:hypothetical protein